MPSRLMKTALKSTVALVAALALTACAAPSGGPVTMMAGPERGQGAALSVGAYDGGPRQVRVIAVTAETIAQYGGSAALGPGGYTYRVGIGDVLQIHAVDAPELTLSSGYRVEGDGAIQVPFLGRIAVDGRATDAIRADLTERLRQYIAQPQVDVRVTGFNARQVTVTGEVARPSRQPLTDRPLTVIDAIHDAGGFQDDPDRARVVLIRDGVEQTVDLRGFLNHGAPTPVLQDGDVIRVGGPRPLFGAARAASRTAFLHDANRLREIDVSGGPVTLAQVVPGLAAVPGTSVFVLRDAGTMIQALRMGAQEATSLDLGGRFHLRPGDMVTLDPNPTPDPDGQVARLTPALRAMNRD